MIKRLAIAVALAMAIVGCDNGEIGSEARRVAVIVARTGPADFIGAPEWDVSTKLVERYKSVGAMPPNVEVTFFDSGSNIKQAQEHFATIAADPRYLAIIGPSTSGESLALAESAEAVKIPLLSLAASKKIVEKEQDADGTKDWVFKFAQNDDLAATKLLTIIKRDNEGKVPAIAVLYADDAFGRSGNEVIQAITAETGLVTITLSAPFPPSMTGTEGVIGSLPAGLDALVVWGTSPGPSLLVQDLARTRPGLQVYLSHGNATNQFIQDAGLSAEGVKLVGSRILVPPTDSNNSASDSAAIQYLSFWKENSLEGSPNHFGGHAYDALTLTLQILSDPDVASRAQFRRHVEQQTSYAGVTGTFSFSSTDHAGLTTEAFSAYEIRDGRFANLD